MTEENKFLKEILDNSKDIETVKRIVKKLRTDYCNFVTLSEKEAEKFDIPRNGLLAILLEEYYLYRWHQDNTKTMNVVDESKVIKDTFNKDNKI